MRNEAKPAYILNSARIPFVKSQTSYAHALRKDLMIESLQQLVRKSNLKGKIVGDTALGCLLNSSADWNMARECLLSTEVHPESPAYNVQRACGTSLEATWQIALKVHTGAIEYGIAGGVDTNSDIPIEVSQELQQFLMKLHRARSFTERLKIISHFPIGSLKPKIPTVTEPRTHLSMGEHCELMVKEWKISREDQDELALASHTNAARAYSEGFFSDLVYPYLGLTKDTTVRPDTTLAQLSKLRPAFDKQNGSLTAGNSSPLTDGSSCVLVGSAKAASQLGLKPLAEVIDAQVAAVDFVGGAGLLMAPTIAVARLLEKNKLTFADFDYFEIHEAFAGQVLCNLKAWESEKYCREVLGLKAALGPVDRKKLNVNGSSLATGHPFSATGTRIVGTLAKMLSTGAKKRGLISICTAGGMGVAAILESVEG